MSLKKKVDVVVVVDEDSYKIQKYLAAIYHLVEIIYSSSQPVVVLLVIMILLLVLMEIIFIFRIV